MVETPQEIPGSPPAGGPEARPAPEPLEPEKLTATRLRSALKEGRRDDALRALEALSPVRRAELFVQLRTAEQKEILAAANPELAASLLAECDSARLSQTLEEMDLGAIEAALRRVPPDNLADIVLHLTPETAARVLERLDPPLREEVRKLREFDPESAGGLMTTRYQSVPDVVTVGRALELLRQGRSADASSYIYVVDALGKLTGVVPLRRLLLAHPRQSIRSVMVKDVTRLKVTAPRDEILDVFNQYHFVSLPVVDDKDRLVGIVTFDDVMAAMRRSEETVLRSVTGADPREALKETWVATRGRLPWITVTILGGLGCALIGGLFQRTLAEMVVLGIFIPIVLALGESIGAQTTSVVLSTLAGGNPSREELMSFVFKELRVGVLVALYSGVIVSVTSLAWHGNPRLGLLIGAAVFISVAWAALLAVVIPGVMKRLRVNPAVASGPLVLALADLSTLLVYFGGATLFMSAVR
jgi:magnesium transporter